MSQDSGSRKTSKGSLRPTQQFSKMDQRVIIRFLYQQDVDSSEIHKLLTAACGVDTPSYKDVRDWMKELDQGRELADLCVCDAGGNKKKSGVPGDSSTDPALIARMEVLVNGDCRVSIEKMPELALVSPPVAQAVISNLGLKRVCERWVPRLWTPEQRAYRVSVCKQLLDLYHAEGVNFFSRVVVGDDSFVLYCSSSSPSNGRSVSTSGKYTPADNPERVNCALYYDMKGILVSEPLPYSEINSEEYGKIIKDLLIPAIKRKRSSQTGPIYLLHRITPVHCSLETMNLFRELNVIPLPNAAASPDLEPYEYWLFRNLKRALDSLNFLSRTDMGTALTRQLHSLTEQDFCNSIEGLQDRWNICIEKQGLYLL